MDSFTPLGCQNGIQTGQLEFPGSLPESMFKVTIFNFLSDLPEESNFQGEIGKLLPDPGQKFQEASQRASLKVKLFQEAFQRQV